MERIPLPDTLAELIQLHCSHEWQVSIREHCTTLHFKAGEDILKEGHPADQLYLIRKGKAKVYRTIGPGSSHILRFARDGQVLGHRGMGEAFTYTVSATALVPTMVDLIPMRLFLDALRANADFSFHFMLFFAEELRLSEATTRFFAQKSVEQRMAKALLDTLRCFGFDTDDPTLLAFTPARQDLADHAGTTYESSIRALSTLQRKKLIRNVGREIRITDLQGLEKVLQEA